MANKTTRTVSIEFRFALAPDSKEMRIETLKRALKRLLDRSHDELEEVGYKVWAVERADWSTKRSDGGGHREGSLLEG
jgi:hypothetical protein